MKSRRGVRGETPLRRGRLGQGTPCSSCLLVNPPALPLAQHQQRQGPSIDVAAKMAELLDVSLDYLVGKTDVLLDGKVLNRIIEIQKLNTEEQKTVFSLLDAYLRDTKTRKAYAA